ncbi:hypothetical protein [Bradyrhizobium elkanii]|uniref:Uncharacterized protein n=1 Tax=Bradyrhizobium elkanii TaxID=29448 RepID=A0A8I1Y7P9_BRAEL|nr:hypothetical protein [Bradyrhizobium elkanii]MBP1294312.1 hypothetical protein [Bradyrhizobium elkanii]
MSNRNPTHARAGNRARFTVPQPVRKGFLKYVATLHYRPDPGWKGIEFKAITSRRAQLAAWRHASMIVNREADHGFDYSV